MKTDSELLAEIADIAGARIKLGRSAYTEEATKRYQQICDLLHDYWDAQSKEP